MHSGMDKCAPGVGLEPTTYGLTVRRAADCATPEKTRQCINLEVAIPFVLVGSMFNEDGLGLHKKT